MDRTVADALRRAASLTRAGNPLEATRAIRAALLGTGDGAEPSPVGRPKASAILGPRVLDLTANRVDREPPRPGTSRPATPKDADGGERRPPRKVVRPLADTIRDLAAGRRAFETPLSRRAGPPPVPAGAQYLSRTFDSTAGSRGYRLYVPPSVAAGGAAAGLVLMLHGCKQDPDDFATGTGMNAQADEASMIVVYPAQTTASNPSGCWNWFDAANQRRGGGEPALLAMLARSVAEEFAVPADALFVAGLSAGGAMAAILVETYPDVFSAAGIHSGLPAGAATDLPSAFAAMAGRGGDRPATATARLIVVHGTADGVVNPSNGDRMMAGWRHGAAATDHETGRTGAGRSYERIVYRSADGRIDAEHWILRDHGHAWSGGHPSGSYTDPAGPDASAAMMRFFRDGLDGRRRPA